MIDPPKDNDKQDTIISISNGRLHQQQLQIESDDLLKIIRFNCKNEKQKLNESIGWSCSHDNETCTLYKIDIDLVGGRATSNQIAEWHQSNVVESFGSVAGFKNGKTGYIVMTTNCNSQANLINISNLSQPISSIMMKTSCTQPIHALSGRWLLALGTASNGVGGSYPVSLYIFDPISSLSSRDIVHFDTMFAKSYQLLHPQTGFSALNLNAAEPIFYAILYNLVNETRHILSIHIETGQWSLNQIGNNLLRNLAFSTELNAPVCDCSLGGICVLNWESFQWDLFLPIPNFNSFMDWTFSADKQTMYFIRKQNITVIDLSNKLSFQYRIVPLIEQTGDINGIDKTVGLDM
ncbi:unnamed protein product [Rotaria sordida]|uniref:Uncharacterized protein n=2 Tax=Rotaria sordida TaxID=392033 RepID=A0A819KEL5_9BILA|nr:unnamed protein product [Rotaria sordida]